MMNHPSLLIERLTQERDEARAALAAAEQAARAAGEEYERSVQVINAAWLTLGKVVRDSVGQTPLIEVHELAELAVKLVERLEAFKAYVHRRLDEAGVPADPDSPHRAEGCRIGGRLDLVLATMKRAEETEKALYDLQHDSPIGVILNEFREAREHGRKKYGGTDPDAHDLGHPLDEWCGFIRDHLDRARAWGGWHSNDGREHLAKAGGLVLSMIWCHDVKSGAITLPSPVAGGPGAAERSKA
jgi:hypothetical protein